MVILSLSLKAKELKTLLAERNQPAYGTKTEMLHRLHGFGQNRDQWES